MSCLQELDFYRLTAGAQLNSGALHRDSPPLMWWKEHAAQFPLSQLARRYLAMPATSASVERLHEAIPGGIERETFAMIDAAATIDLDDD